MVCAMLFAFTGIGTGWASNFFLFVSFQVLNGVPVGATTLVCPMYAAEISSATIRGNGVFLSAFHCDRKIACLFIYLTSFRLKKMKACLPNPDIK
jgi:hypothetical protein